MQPKEKLWYCLIVLNALQYSNNSAFYPSRCALVICALLEGEEQPEFPLRSILSCSIMCNHGCVLPFPGWLLFEIQTQLLFLEH